ncbi:pyridoxamine 5'-phosphate oxidase family protein [Rhodomicrobium vannielii ATCC 17100]|uniref:pyridoxamine 5'-phosphate oxidase family protein n=1 Tax=Rhodomicrobium vannielii TaxID=1069 RepID=UPI00191B0710|nr:pyridoxamine 5'-phosphate oxidase family protein [Rhodomicrobium vannielii]MBJ7534153.1 pyridoxamine 5'-phosphate oxidase family protein [Rhodomicrobium vannielii ATCC 17100]
MTEAEAPNSTPPSARTTVNRYRWLAKYDKDTIHAILDAQPLCHVAFIHDGKPVVTPTMQWREGDRIYWHGAAAGRAMKASTSAEVCLCVSILDGFVMARAAFNFNVNHRSVMVFGKAEQLTDRAEKERQLKRMVDGYVAGQWDRLRPVTEAEMNATTILSLSLDEASAKVRTGHPEDNDADYDFPAWAGTIPIRFDVGEPIPDPRNLPGVEMPAGVKDFKIG